MSLKEIVTYTPEAGLPEPKLAYSRRTQRAQILRGTELLVNTKYIPDTHTAISKLLPFQVIRSNGRHLQEVQQSFSTDKLTNQILVALIDYTSHHVKNSQETPSRTYELISEIGTGGLSFVYRAIESGTGEEFAVKKLQPSYAFDQRCRQFFVQEGAVMMSLHHEHIVQGLDFFEDKGELYLVMPLIKAPTIKEILKQRTLSLREIKTIILQLIDAGLYAKQHGVIIKDLKPGNLFWDGKNILVTDFGVLDIDNVQPITEKGKVNGTLGYIPPESFEDDSNGIAHFIYQVGGPITFELLVGKPMFNEPTVNGTLTTLIRRNNDKLRFIDLQRALQQRKIVLENEIPEDEFEEIAGRYKKNADYDLHDIDPLIRFIMKSAHMRAVRRFTTIEAFRQQFLEAVEKAEKQQDLTLIPKLLVDAPSVVPVHNPSSKVVSATAPTRPLSNIIVVPH